MSKDGEQDLKHIALVCLGSALVMMTGQYIYVDFGAISDIARLAAQVISGVGFLGVGTIMVTRDNHVKGLTTAAGVWTCAGIGLGIGIGFYSGAAITTILVLVIYRFMGRVDEIAYEHSRVLDIYIEFESRRSIAPFISVLKENNYKIMQMELNKSKKNKEETCEMRRWYWKCRRRRSMVWSSIFSGRSRE